MSVSVTRDRRPRMPLKVTYKVIITNPDGSIAQVIEGKNDDPFTYSFVWLFYGSLIAPSQSIDIPDVAGTELFLFTPAVPTSYQGAAVAIPYPDFTLCLVNCPGTPNAPYAVKLPGIWLFSTPFSGQAKVSTIYSSLITNVIYYTPSISPSITATVGATNTITITQTIYQYQRLSDYRCLLCCGRCLLPGFHHIKPTIFEWYCQRNEYSLHRVM